ncbi:MAG: hypothetical protein DM484_10665 [Candidatus Methylumidiphilus alinenensis]|uniref:Uncharacterized protein n=1 Tax=Candidatus Methylumidiphilus alinenensis TaxID=2202197 RepID=A0A2W4R7N7_9GAMM|nr:MAG: hypothetical protein DM484_10665 [Candidatus Methylumidiphilus alinenensis]
MKHRIDPKIDCVFKALLGSEENRNLLVHFLNAVSVGDLTAPITEAEILNVARRIRKARAAPPLIAPYIKSTNVMQYGFFVLRRTWCIMQ